MWVHNLNPVLFSLGPVSVYWYGLVYVLGFVGMYYALRSLALFSEKEADSFVTWAVVGLFFGSRLFHFVFYRPDLFSITEFFAVWNGGMSFHGAVFGLVVSAYYWCRFHNKRFWHVADVVALCAAPFLFLGRLANFVNSEIVGTPFSGSWCVVFPSVDDVCRHPVQLYAALKNVVLGLIVFGVYKRSSYRDGFVFWVFSLTYSVLRFLVNFLREDVSYIGVLKMGHLLSIGLFVVSLYFLVSYHRSDFLKLLKGE